MLRSTPNWRELSQLEVGWNVRGGEGEELTGLGPGLKWDSPLEWEIFRLRDRPSFGVTLALPPGVDVLLELFFGRRLLGAEWNNCTQLSRSRADCRQGLCSCRCSGSCECSSCTRGSRVQYKFSVEEGVTRGGDYHIEAVANYYEHRTGGHTALRIGSHFTVVEDWRDAFESTCSLRRGACPVCGGRVRAPAYPLPGNLYTRVSSQAAGSLAMQPGVIFVAPAPGRVYAAGERLSLTLRFLDFVPEVNGRVTWCLVQVFEEGCGGPKGCSVSQPFLPQGAWREGVLAQDCEHDEAGCEIASFRLTAGYYRAVVSLKDRSGEELTGLRFAVFAVAKASREELARSPSSYRSSPGHAMYNNTPLRQHAQHGNHAGDVLTSVGGESRRAVLLVYEWTPLPGLNGDADRLRQLTFALDELGYDTHIYASKCLSMHGDYFTMAPRSAAAHISCDLRETEVPALLQEGPAYVAAFVVSTEWYFPQRSLVQSFVPLIREANPSTKVIVMADVLIAPDGEGLDENGGGPHVSADDVEHDDKQSSFGSFEDETVRGNPSDDVLERDPREDHATFASWAAVAQLMGLAAADAVGVEVEEDIPWLRSLMPALPVLPVRFTTVLPAIEEVPPFDRRSGMLWFGSAHGDNRQAVEWVALSVLPLVKKLLGPQSQDAFLVVAGQDTDSSQVLQSAQAVRVLGRVQDTGPFLDSAKVCLSPTMLGSRRFQTKHLQSISRGLPVVATERGVAGYGLASHLEEGPRRYGSGQGFVVASAGREMDEEEALLLAKAVVDLVTNRSAWERESSGALGLARTRFAFAEGRREVEALLEAAGVRGGGSA